MTAHYSSASFIRVKAKGGEGGGGASREKNHNVHV
jgi:hypothetical protein